MPKIAKLIKYSNSPSERFIEKNHEDVHIIKGNVSDTWNKKYFGKDFDILVGDVVDWRGNEFEVTEVSEKILLARGDQTIFNQT